MTNQEKLEKCVKILRSTETDNDKFAALLLVAKTTKSQDLSSEEKEALLEAIGLTFLLRLLKSNSAASPEGCPPHIFKSLALEILSGLCTDPGVVVGTSLQKILKPINEVLNFDEQAFDGDDGDMKDMVDNCMTILQRFSSSLEGVEQLICNNTVFHLAQLINRDTYGCEKATDLCKVVVMSATPESWFEQDETVHLLLDIFSGKMQQTQEQEKFELCETVSSIIRVAPKSVVEDHSNKQWYGSILASMKDIFTSKLGEAQRIPALKMAAAVLNRLEIEFVLPPNTADVRILLVLTHLSCIEIRMILENLPLPEIISKADLLCACYHLLEIVIGYMTVSPSLLLDEKQILQLHSAMMGAFNAIIFFLKEVSEDEFTKAEPPNPVVIATVRVLGSWLAEETSALREKTHEILPFLLKLCKLQMQYTTEFASKGDNFCPGSDTKDNDDMNLTERMESCTVESLDSESKESEKKKVHFEETVTEDCSSTGSQENGRDITMETDTKGDNCANCSSQSHADTDIQSESRTLSQDCEKSIHSSGKMDHIDGAVDIIRFLLPGLCHLTTEEEPIKLLLEHDLEALLTKYFMDSVKTFLEDISNATLMRGIELLCNVFLNLTILVPKQISTNEEFHLVTKTILETVPNLARKPEVIVLWANMMTLGMFRLRHHREILESMVSNEDKVKFFTSVVMFIKGAFTNVRSGSKQILAVCEIYSLVWEDISQLWFLNVQATSECISIYQELIHAMLFSGVVPHIIKVLLAVQGREVTDEVKKCIMTLLTSIGSIDPKALEVIRSSGGLKLAQMYKSDQLKRLLRK